MPPAPRSRSRSAARLAAVQAVYQQEMEGTPLPRLIKEFHDHRLGLQGHAEALEHGLPDAARQCEDLRAGGIAVVHQHEGMTVGDPGVAVAMAFPARGFESY